MDAMSCREQYIEQDNEKLTDFILIIQNLGAHKHLYIFVWSMYPKF